MNLKLDNDVFFDEFGAAVAVATSDCSLQQKNEILAGAEILAKVRNFIERTKSGTLRPKSTCDDFQATLDKYDIE